MDSLRQRYIELGIIKPQEEEENMAKKGKNKRTNGNKSDKSIEFHNPYHFVPVKKPDVDKWHETGVSKTNKARRKEFCQKLPLHCRHDIYAEKTNEEKVYHGRIYCTLKTQSPIFIGARRLKKGTDREPACIAPFELDDRPAIPASTLRGLISSIAEAASNSALRVLENRGLSRRKEVNEALSALGMIEVEYHKNGKEIHKLFPLTAPVMQTKWQYVPKTNNRPDYTKLDKTLPFQLEEGFKKAFNNYSVPIRICFDSKKDANRKPNKTYTAKHNEFYYMKTKPNYTNSTLTPDNSYFKTKPIQKKKRGGNRKIEACHLLLYQKGYGNDLHMATDFSEENKAEWTKGIIRYFTEKVGHKRHHYFIPFDGIKKDHLLDIPENVVNEFHMLADERTEATKNEKPMPNIPVGVTRNEGSDPNDKRVRLKTGDIVFFGVNDNGEVNEISFSSIWRRDCGGTVHNFFKKINSELLPFNPDREKLSPAELIFGFVEDWKGRENKNVEALSYKGRVRFSHGIMKDESDDFPYENEVILKILDSPKPPCPCMYFEKKGKPTQFISKNKLDCNGQYLPKGRKFYLHHNQDFEDRKSQDNGRKLPSWETHPDLTKPGDKESRLKQKARITPIKQGKTFGFHVDFENLTCWELGLLCYALRPRDDFRHKIGMGKPIGLGTVEITPDKIEFIDRIKRYSVDTLQEERYSVNNGDLKTPKDFASYFRNLSDKEILDPLELLGRPEAVKHQVHTPLLTGQKNAEEEKETFRWFVKNEKKSNSLKN